MQQQIAVSYTRRPKCLLAESGNQWKAGSVHDVR